MSGGAVYTCQGSFLGPVTSDPTCFLPAHRWLRGGPPGPALLPRVAGGQTHLLFSWRQTGPSRGGGQRAWRAPRAPCQPDPSSLRPAALLSGSGFRSLPGSAPPLLGPLGEAPGPTLPPCLASRPGLRPVQPGRPWRDGRCREAQRPRARGPRGCPAKGSGVGDSGPGRRSARAPVPTSCCTHTTSLLLSGTS